MQRQRGGLIPIGDTLSGMGGPMKSIREASPQALHHFTQADQVNLLVGASEARWQKQDRVEREVLQGNHQPSGATLEVGVG